MVGTPEVIDEAVELNQNKRSALKVVGRLHDYLSCKVKFAEDRKKAWPGQLYVMESLEKKVGALVMKVQSYKNSGMRNFLFLGL